MSLTMLLSSSSFFLTDHIAKLIETKQATASQINYASKLGLPSALKYQFSSASIGSRQWLYAATKLGQTEGEFAFKLAEFYDHQGDLSTALIWVKRAVKLNNVKARLYLGRHYFLQAKYMLAKELLSSIAEQQEAITLLVEIAIIQGEYTFISSQVKFLDSFDKGQELLSLINKYQILESLLLAQLKPNENQIEQKCTANVQMFATTLKGLKKVDKLIAAFNSHPLNPYFCFNTVRYIPESKLSCYHQKEHAIQCDESIWADVKQDAKTRYLGIMLPAGGANVNAGILYLDIEDNEQVFAHELSHLLGFVDEYALVKDHQQCRENQSAIFSHNISVIKSFYQGSKAEVRARVLKKLSWAKLIKRTTPVLHETSSGWKVGTPDIVIKGDISDKNPIGVFPSATCNLHDIEAFKPLKKFTQLTYFASDFPNEYIDLLKESSEKHLMPSYHYNVAKHLLQNAHESLAFKWLDKALSKEVEDTPRYKKIKRGAY